MIALSNSLVIFFKEYQHNVQYTLCQPFESIDTFRHFVTVDTLFT
jgi:hypothetical protein